MQASLEALGAVAPAVVTALRASVGLNALVDPDASKGIHEGGAPNPTTGTQPEKYVVVRSASSLPAGVFSSVGANAALELHVWYPGRSETPVLAIIAEIGKALEGVKLSLGGSFRHWDGTCQLIGILDDTNARPVSKHAIVRYEARVQ